MDNGDSSSNPHHHLINRFESLNLKSFPGINVPIDLVEQILVKLPVKSLLRFKSVCKSWNSLINDPKFIDKHLQVNISKSERALSPSSSDKSTILLGHSCFKPGSGFNLDASKFRLLSLAVIGSDDEISFSSENIDHLLEINCDTFLGDRICGSHCNGVLCLVDFSPDDEYQAVFYNPALRQHRSFIAHKSQPNPKSDIFGFYFGFGYDPRTQDYKFLKFLWPLEYGGPYKVEVYTLGTDSWRVVKPPDKRHLNLMSGAYLKGCYYWFNQYTMSLLSIDMSEDSFGSVALPLCDRISDIRRRTHGSLMVHTESLVLAVYSIVHELPFSNDIDIWMTKTMDGRDWTKQHTVMLGSYPVMSLITFVKDDVVLMEDQSSCLVLYNIFTGNRRKLPMKPTFVASSYVESLVSVKLTQGT